jgi:hypothetical protein
MFRANMPVNACEEFAGVFGSTFSPERGLSVLGSAGMFCGEEGGDVGHENIEFQRSSVMGTAAGRRILPFPMKVLRR